MKTSAIVLTAFIGASPAPLSAQQEAFRGSLSQYLNLDEEGVRVGRSTFHHFRLLPLQNGTSRLSSQFVDVVPLTETNGEPGFRFEIMDGATADDFFELRFAFEVSGPGMTGTRIVLKDVNVRDSSNATADVILDLAAEGKAPGSLDSLITLAAPGGFEMLEDEAFFTVEPVLGIELDAVLSGGGEGAPGVVFASVGSITVLFDEILPPPDPRPLVIKESGLTDEKNFYIEFTSTPSQAHQVVASTTLVEGFPIEVTPIGGVPVTDASGFARVEIDLTHFPSSAFFAIKTSS